jgi:predicted Zn-dependent protease
VRGRSYQQALPLLDAYGTVDPGNRLFLLLRSQAAEGLRNRDEALKWVRRGLSAYPDDPELLTATARLLLQASASIAGGQEAAKEEGREHARRAAELAASSPAAAGLTTLQSKLRAAAGFEALRLLLADAIQRFDWAQANQRLGELKQGPGFEDKAVACLIYRKTGNWPAALELATAWYGERPDLEAATEAYVRALVGTKNESAAQDLIPRLLAGKASPGFRSTLFYLQSLLQKSEEASLSLLRQALVENADNLEALTAFYDYYYRKSDWQKARFYLKQALSLAPADPDLLRRNRELSAAAP